jgi:hypothetical protein
MSNYPYERVFTSSEHALTSTLSDRGSIFGGDNERIFGLDPWHKMLFGWTEPRLVMVGQTGTRSLLPTTSARQPNRCAAGRSSSSIRARARPSSSCSNIARPTGWAMTATLPHPAS